MRIGIISPNLIDNIGGNNALLPWEDVLGFRDEERTQHLVRSLRRWIRKVVAEDWCHAELQDEVRERMFEYENHMRLSRLKGCDGALEFLITGAAEVAEDVVKLRFGKIAKLATAMLNRRVQLRPRQRHRAENWRSFLS